MLLTVMLGHIMDEIPEEEVAGCMEGLAERFDLSLAEIAGRIDETGQLSDEDREEILRVGKDYVKEYRESRA